MPDSGVMPRRAASIESRASWTAACLTLAILSISYGAPLLVVVGLKPIQEALGTDGLRATRPIEVLQPIQALALARTDYLDSVLSYNRAQFRLQRAIGQP